MAQLTLENLRKQFTPQVIPVKDISLTVNDGDFITLLDLQVAGNRPY